jgi:hypothetical protein
MSYIRHIFHISHNTHSAISHINHQPSAVIHHPPSRSHPPSTISNHRTSINHHPSPINHTSKDDDRGVGKGKGLAKVKGSVQSPHHHTSVGKPDPRSSSTDQADMDTESSPSEPACKLVTLDFQPALRPNAQPGRTLTCALLATMLSPWVQGSTKTETTP